MVTNVRRPIGVLFVAILLIVTGALGVVSGILALSGSLFGAWLIAVGALNIIFAFGILRGSRVARMFVTILQIVGIVSSIIAMAGSGDVMSQLFNGVVFPLVITLLLWVGAETKAFFAQNN